MMWHALEDNAQTYTQTHAEPLSGGPCWEARHGEHTTIGRTSRKISDGRSWFSGRHNRLNGLVARRDGSACGRRLRVGD